MQENSNHIQIKNIKMETYNNNMLTFIYIIYLNYKLNI